MPQKRAGCKRYTRGRRTHEPYVETPTCCFLAYCRHVDGLRPGQPSGANRGDHQWKEACHQVQRQWKLIVNKQTGQWGLEYHQDRDLGRVPMMMSKPPKPIETLKISLSGAGGNQGKLDMEWENYVASVPFTVK